MTDKPPQLRTPEQQEAGEKLLILCRLAGKNFSDIYLSLMPHNPSLSVEVVRNKLEDALYWIPQMQHEATKASLSFDHLESVNDAAKRATELVTNYLENKSDLGLGYITTLCSSYMSDTFFYIQALGFVYIDLDTYLAYLKVVANRDTSEE